MAAAGSYSRNQLADHLGTFPSMIWRAEQRGLVPGPDRADGTRWSVAAAQKIRRRWPKIAPQVECIGAPGLKTRGWTEAMIRDLLGAPDYHTANPYYKSAAPRRLWLLHRALAAEGTPEFAARLTRAGHQRAAAAQGAETKQILKALGGFR